MKKNTKTHLITYFFINKIYFLGRFLYKSSRFILKHEPTTQKKIFMLRENAFFLSVFATLIFIGTFLSFMVFHQYKNTSPQKNVLQTSSSSQIDYFYHNNLSLLFSHIHPTLLIPYASSDVDLNQSSIGYNPSISYETVIFFYLSLLSLDLNRSSDWLDPKEKELFNNIECHPHDRALFIIQKSFTHIEKLKRKKDNLLPSASMNSTGQLLPSQKVDLYQNYLFSFGLWICYHIIAEKKSDLAQNLSQDILNFLKSQDYKSVSNHQEKKHVELFSKEGVMALWNQINSEKNNTIFHITDSLYQLSNKQVIPLLLTEKGTLENLHLLLFFISILPVDNIHQALNYLLHAQYDKSLLEEEVGLIESSFNREGKKIDIFLKDFSYKMTPPNLSSNNLFYWVKLDGLFLLSPFMKQSMKKKWSFFLEQSLQYKYLIFPRKKGVSSRVLELKTIYLYFLYHSSSMINFCKTKMASIDKVQQLAAHINTQWDTSLSPHFSFELNLFPPSYKERDSKKTFNEPNNIQKINIISYFKINLYSKINNIFYQINTKEWGFKWGELFYQDCLTYDDNQWIPFAMFKQNYLHNKTSRKPVIELEIFSSSAQQLNIRFQNHCTDIYDPAIIPLKEGKQTIIIELTQKPHLPLLAINKILLSLLQKEILPQNTELIIHQINLSYK